MTDIAMNNPEEAADKSHGKSPTGALKQLKKAIKSMATDCMNAPSSLISLWGQSANLRKTYRSTTSVDKLVARYRAEPGNAPTSLDLGCGSKPRNPFGANQVFGVDIRGDLPSGTKQADLSLEGIPYEADSFDFCTAHNLLEHIPRDTWVNNERRASFIELMNEVHRILKPGGLFLHVTPAYPSKQAFQDPTHVNIITEETMPNYFCDPKLLAGKLGYGFNGRFKLIEQRWMRNIWIVGIMRAIK